MGKFDRGINKRKKISKDRRRRIFIRDGGACVHCGSIMDLTIGHIKSVYHGGTNDDWNLQVECYPCNLARGNQDMSIA